MGKFRFGASDRVITTTDIPVSSAFYCGLLRAGMLGTVVFSYAGTGAEGPLIRVKFDQEEFWVPEDALDLAPMIRIVTVTVKIPHIPAPESLSMCGLIVAKPPRHFPAVSVIAVLSREAARKRRFVGEARRAK